MDMRKSQCVETNKNFPEKVAECQRLAMVAYRDGADEVYSNFYKKQAK